MVGLLWGVLWAALSYQAWLCAAGPKLTVLYLRRFRLASAQAIVTAALEQGLGSRYRLVTLDDANFPPMEVPRLYRAVSRFASPALWLVLVVAVALVLERLYSGASPTIQGAGANLMLSAAAMLLAPYLLSLTSAAVTLALGLLALRWRIRRRAKLSVRATTDLPLAARAVTVLGKWSQRSAFLAPRATVISVRDDLWRPLVTELLDSVDVVLVDVSVSSPHLQWELDELDARAMRNVVLVAHRDSSEAADLARDRGCIWYEDVSRGGDARRFLDELTDSLDERAAARRRFEAFDGIVMPIVGCVRALAILLLGASLLSHSAVALISAVNG